MIITTTHTIEGRPVAEYLGVVTGETIVGASRRIGKNGATTTATKTSCSPVRMAHRFIPTASRRRSSVSWLARVSARSPFTVFATPTPLWAWLSVCLPR